MELALIVWIISILYPIKVVLILAAICCVLLMFIHMITCIEDDEPFFKRGLAPVTTVMALLITTTAILPSEKTAYLMVGAYAAQKIAEDPKVQQISGKVLTVIEAKIDQYVEEAEQTVKGASK